MNTHKAANRMSKIDLKLSRTLSHWAVQQVPPVRIRRELMRTVRHEALSHRHLIMRLPSDGFIETVNLGPVITFNHCFSMFYTLHSRVRL